MYDNALYEKKKKKIIKDYNRPWGLRVDDSFIY